MDPKSTEKLFENEFERGINRISILDNQNLKNFLISKGIEFFGPLEK